MCTIGPSRPTDPPCRSSAPCERLHRCDPPADRPPRSRNASITSGTPWPRASGARKYTSGPTMRPPTSARPGRAPSEPRTAPAAAAPRAQRQPLHGGDQSDEDDRSARGEDPVRHGSKTSCAICACSRLRERGLAIYSSSEVSPSRSAYFTRSASRWISSLRMMFWRDGSRRSSVRCGAARRSRRCSLGDQLQDLALAGAQRPDCRPARGLARRRDLGDLRAQVPLAPAARRGSPRAGRRARRP